MPRPGSEWSIAAQPSESLPEEVPQQAIPPKILRRDVPAAPPSVSQAPVDHHQQLQPHVQDHGGTAFLISTHSASHPESRRMSSCHWGSPALPSLPAAELIECSSGQSWSIGAAYIPSEGLRCHADWQSDTCHHVIHSSRDLLNESAPVCSRREPPQEQPRRLAPAS